MLDLEKTPHTSPLRARYGVSFVNICEKIDRAIMALHCIQILMGVTASYATVKIYGTTFKVSQKV